jgi:hypothetical protein
MTEKTMHNYTFEINRESDPDHVYFPFRFQASVRLPARELWEEWLRTISGVEGSWLWPRRYTQPSVRPGPPQVGGLLLNSYRIPNPHDPSKPDKVTAYEFHIEICDNEAMKFKYRATDDHPFLEGGGTLTVVPVDEGSSLLRWNGKYRHANDHDYSEKQGDVFAFFICNFFTVLAQNIKTAVGFDDPEK